MVVDAVVKVKGVEREFGKRISAYVRASAVQCLLVAFAEAWQSTRMGADGVAVAKAGVVGRDYRFSAWGGTNLLRFGGGSARKD